MSLKMRRWVSAGFWLCLAVLLCACPTPAVRAEELYAWKDDAGAVHVVDSLAKVPEVYRGKLVGSGTELTDLWDGNVLRKLPLPNDAQMHFQQMLTPHFEVFWEQGLGVGRVGVIPLSEGEVPRRLEELLERAGNDVEQRLGLRAEHRVQVLLYRRASYQARYGETFPFRTAGFYDGRIHVAADALDSKRLPPLIRHEYAHAIFWEYVGSHRPFWLNEGLAGLAARRSVRLTDGERRQLGRVVESGTWIELEALGGGFGGLTKGRVAQAYLQSTAAAAWILETVAAHDRGLFLREMGREETASMAFMRFLGIEPETFDHVLREAIRNGAL